MRVESRAISERSFVSLGKYSAEVQYNETSEEDIFKYHSKFLTLIAKRQKELEILLEMYEAEEFGKLVGRLVHADLSVQCDILPKLCSGKKVRYNLDYAEIYVSIIVKLVRSKTKRCIDIGAKCLGDVLMNSGPEISASLTSKLSVDPQIKEKCERIFGELLKVKILLESCGRGFQELVDLTYLVDKVQSNIIR